MYNTSRVEKKIKKRKSGLIFIILLMIITIFFIFFTKTNFFHVSHIIIKGNDILEDEKIVMASGLVMNESIFKANTDVLEKNLLRHPYIKEAKVDRNFPDTIIINVKEKKETAVLSYIGSYVYIDEDGKVLNILSELKDKNLPYIDNLDIETPRIGEKIKLDGNDSVDIQEVLKFLSRNKESAIVKDITNIKFDNNSNMIFQLRNGKKVVFGELENVEYKLQFLKKILEVLKRKKIVNGTIDMTKGENPVFVPDSN